MAGTHPSTPPPMYADALAAALGIVRPGPVERVALDAAAGRTLREPIVADRDQPPFDRAQMDGYALRHADLRVGEPMPVVARVAAGTSFDGPVAPGSCVAIATGAPIPDGLDTVVEHERSDRADRTGDDIPVRFRSAVARGHAVHRRGTDAVPGTALVRPGTVLGARHIALAAAVGATAPAVAVRPTIAILTSGDEVVAPDTAALRPAQIRNGNGPMIAVLVAAMGGAAGARSHIADEEAPTRLALAAALDGHDIVVTIGGISAGERDRFRGAAEDLGVAFIVRRARLQPGGPIVIGRSASGAILVGLPGNPVSALACAHLFLWPIVRARLGAGSPPWRTVSLAEPVTPNATRQAFRPAAIGADGAATVPRWAGSGDLAHTATTDGLVELPMQATPLEAGARTRFLPWADGFAAVAERPGSAGDDRSAP